ncbi:MAG: hypothetical protein J0H08_17590 [Rhizobiales bacterium]|nr:hypothetical protein [Hyphomicrobiales bacterium]
MTAFAARGMLALALAALSGLPVAAQGTDALHLECVGPFGPDGSEAGLRQIFGDANVQAETIDGPEGSTLDATLLFPDDPIRRLVVLWQGEGARAKPAAIIIRDDSECVGPGGLRLGDELAEVESRAASFPSGTLADIPGECVMSLSFDLDWTREYGPEFDSIMGDQQLRSDDAQLRAATPKVAEIIVGYPVEDDSIEGETYESGE